MDFAFMGKQLKENHFQTKKLFEFTEEENNPRLNFKLNEPKIQR